MQSITAPLGAPIHLRHLAQPPAQNQIKFVNPNTENYERNIRNAASLGLPCYSKGQLGKPCRVVICGSGPSLKDPAVLEVITGLSYDGYLIVGCKAAIGFLDVGGICVDWGVSMDPGAHIATEHKIKRVKGVQHLIASSSDPALFEYLKDEDVLVFHSATGYPGEVELYEELFPNGACMGGGFNVVNRAISAFMYMGAEEVVLAGVDSGWREGDDFYVDGSESKAGVDMCDHGAIDGTPWWTRPDMLASAVSMARLSNQLAPGVITFLGDTLPGALRLKDDAFLKQVADFK